MNRRYELILGMMVLLSFGCKKDEKTVQPAAAQPPASVTPPTPPTPPASSSFVVYSDDLHSGGGAFLYPGGDNQGLQFFDSSNPSAGSKSMHYAWNGGDPDSSGSLSENFAGVDLMHVGSLSDYNSTPGVDKRAGAFTKVVFDARGSLGPDVVIKIEVSDDGNGGRTPPCIVLSASGLENDSTPGNFVPPCLNHATLSSSWQHYTLAVTNSDLASIKDYFKATFIYKLPPAIGTGGAINFDAIEYQP